MGSAESLAALRDILEEVAARGTTITYRELADELDIASPHVIRQVGDLLERTMREDAAVGHPFLASVVVSQAEGLPRRGFFERARRLGRYQGDAEGPEARAYFESEYRAVLDAWRGY